MPVGAPKRVFSPETIRMIQILYLHGHKPTQIAKTLGIPRKTLTDRLEKDAEFREAVTTGNGDDALDALAMAAIARNLASSEPSSQLMANWAKSKKGWGKDDAQQQSPGDIAAEMQAARAKIKAEEEAESGNGTEENRAN